MSFKKIFRVALFVLTLCGAMAAQIINPGGAGSGTVTKNGSLTTKQVIIGGINGTTDITADTGCSTNGAGALTCGSLTSSGTGPDVFTAIADVTTASGDFWYSSTNAGFFKYYDGTHINTFTTIQAAPTSTHLAAFSGTTGLLVDGGAPYSLPAPYQTRGCEIVWGGTNTSNVMQAGDDGIVNESCLNVTGVTITITAIYCYADAGTPTVNPNYGTTHGGSRTTILSGALTCGADSFASSTSFSAATVPSLNAIDPVMGGTFTSTHDIHVIIKYTVPAS